MRAAGYAITVVAVVLMLVAVTPDGDLAQWVAGLVLLFVGAGFGSVADNRDLRYGGGRAA